MQSSSKLPHRYCVALIIIINKVFGRWKQMGKKRALTNCRTVFFLTTWNIVKVIHYSTLSNSSFSTLQKDKEEGDK